MSRLVVRSARGLPDLEPDLDCRVVPDPPLHALPEDAHEGVFDVVDVGDPGAACSTLACRPSLIAPQVSRWRRRPPDHAMTVSTRLGTSAATIAPLLHPRPRRRIEPKADRSAMTVAT